LDDTLITFDTSDPTSATSAAAFGNNEANFAQIAAQTEIIKLLTYGTGNNTATTYPIKNQTWSTKNDPMVINKLNMTKPPKIVVTDIYCDYQRITANLS
jgi:hypothetical protein